MGWFERTWAELFQVDGFDPVPMPRESEITLRVTLQEGRYDVAKNMKLFEDSNTLSRHFAETQS
jgi:hypothetical protein